MKNKTARNAADVKERVVECWKHEASGAGASLTYVYNVNPRYARAPHLVIRRLPAGEDVSPDVWRCETAEKARKVWRQLRAERTAQGYTRMAA